jgi:hypothetical protein
MTEGRESTTNVVCTGAGFDPHETWLEVSHVPLQSPPRQLLAHDHFPTRIHSYEVKATLAEIHSDCSDTVLCVTMSVMARSFRESAALLQHCHSLGGSAAGPYHYLVDGTEFRWTRKAAAAITDERRKLELHRVVE